MQLLTFSMLLQSGLGLREAWGTMYQLGVLLGDSGYPCKTSWRPISAHNREHS